MRPRNLTVNVARLQSLIEELHQQGVEILLVTIPTTRFYRDQIEPQAYQRMQQTLQQLTQNYPVTYRNYMFDARFTDTDFQDGDHLNCRGAQKFSELLKEETSALLNRQPERSSISAGGAP
jgi:hypothetical protein